MKSKNTLIKPEKLASNLMISITKMEKTLKYEKL